MKLTEFHVKKAQHMFVALSFPHQKFNPDQFGFGTIELRKGERSLILDTNEGKVGWAVVDEETSKNVKPTLLVRAFIMEDVEDSSEQDLTVDDVKQGLDHAEVFVEEGYGEWEVDVKPISAKLYLQGDGIEISVPLDIDLAICIEDESDSD